MNHPQGPQHVLGDPVGGSGQRPGLPTHPFPVGLVETGLQAGLAGGERLLELHELLSDLLNNAHTQTHKTQYRNNKT